MSSTNIETDFLYLYGVILPEELQHAEVPSILGIDHRYTSIKPFKEIGAVITPVNPIDFSQTQIDNHIRDAEWLKEKAFHHHQIISDLHRNMTILPMSFCTIFQNEGNLETLLANQYESIYNKLLILKDNQEWNIKMLCKHEKVLSYVFEHNTSVVELREKIAGMPKGKQFLMKKKLEHLIAAELEVEQSKWLQRMNNHLSSIVAGNKLRRNWGKEVTNLKDEMIGNCDFLVEKGNTDQFLEKIQEVEKWYEEMGCTLQVTGPWPPYHFAKMEKESS